MFRYILQRSLTYLVMVFITTTMGYFAAVTALKPALLEQEKVPKPSPEQVNRNFASLGLDPEMNPWDRYVQWLTNVVTKFDWGRSPNGAYINQEFGQRVWVSTRLLLVATILSIVIGIAL
ncbi:MAG: ABC transporter permease, partial [Rothia mucilaginosa]